MEHVGIAGIFSGVGIQGLNTVGTLPESVL